MPTSPHAKQILTMEAEFRKKVRAVRNVAFEAKANLKDKRETLEKIGGLQGSWRNSNGKNADKLNSFTYDELVNDVGYL